MVIHVFLHGESGSRPEFKKPWTRTRAFPPH